METSGTMPIVFMPKRCFEWSLVSIIDSESTGVKAVFNDLLEPSQSKSLNRSQAYRDKQTN